VSVELTIPDIGNFTDVDVVDVLVKPGDLIEVDTPLITLETDKASMDVPSTAAGRISEVLLKRGDKVSKGSLIARVEAGASASAAAPANTPAAAPTNTAAAATAPQADSGARAARTPVRADAGDTVRMPSPQVRPPGETGGDAARSTELLVLGSGPGGYTAAFRAADLGLKVTLVERYADLGGVCLNVGCIPSKALLHAAKVIEDAHEMSARGIAFGAPQIDRAKLRTWKQSVVTKLTGGLKVLARQRKVEVVRGAGRFAGPNVLEVRGTTGVERIRFEQCIIAAGSEVIRLPGLPEDPRIIDSTDALEVPAFSGPVLVIGGGIIGLEMATVYSTLGTRIDVVEMLDGLMTGADRDLVKVWEKKNAGRFDKVMLKTKTVAAEATPEGIKVRFEGEKAPAQPQLYDMVLVAVGRSPNGRNIDAEKAGVAVSERGFIPVDRQMRTNMPHIFAIGDIVGQPMLAHKAVHEGHVAAETAAGRNSVFEARQIPSVAYTDPEVAWAGLTEEQCKAQGIKYGKAVFPWAASGRAIANGRDEGFTKLLFDESSHRVLGGGIVGTHAGDLIGEVCLAVEMGCDPVDIGKTIHPHPTLSESIGMAAEAFEGVCTDLPPMKKK